MNTREKILNHLESNKPTSAREFHHLTGAPKSRITQLLRELTESGQLEIHSVHNGIKRYRLTELHANRRQAFWTGWKAVTMELQELSQQQPE